MVPTDLLRTGPTLVMGIVNVTPDSFADPPRGVEAAIAWGLALAEQGADLIDVGGVSTRPGSLGEGSDGGSPATPIHPVSEEEELARVVPVVRALAEAGLTISVDTFRARVAAAALAAGASLVNDVTGGLADPDLLRVVADSGTPVVLQHWRTPFDHRPSHVNVVAEVCAELADRADRALAAGIPQSRLILDPGIGFGKSAADNWALVAHAGAIAGLGYPVLWGVSRKRFLAEAYARPTTPPERDEAGLAVTTLLARERVWAVRTHAVAQARTAIAVAEAILAAEGAA